MKLLFVKRTLEWPRSSGQDVHTYYMMQACASLGHTIGLFAASDVTAEATAGLPLAFQAATTGGVSGAGPLRLSKLQERFRSYWGVARETILALAEAERAFAPDAVIIVGLDGLPYLGGVERAVRVWYAADEWIWHHLSLVQPLETATYTHLKTAAVKGLYERAYAPLIDRAWVVSETERRAMRWLAGVRRVDVVPNGVDADFFRPLPGAIPQPRTAVFWGRLDFEPNIQGLEWFCRQVWPAIRQAVPDAGLTVIGFKPGPEVRALAAMPGVTLKGALPDLRAEVQRHAVAVLPFVSGGGIKNKLLEAAAMGMPIVCSPRALMGLRQPLPPAIARPSTPAGWVAALTALWSDDEQRRRDGSATREWVMAAHSWRAAAERAVQGIADTRRGQRTS